MLTMPRLMSAIPSFLAVPAGGSLVARFDRQAGATVLGWNRGDPAVSVRLDPIL